jgi:predicted peptidase
MRNTKARLQTTLTKQVTLPYLRYAPSELPGRVPLVLFLHGAGERGHDVDAVRRHGLPKVLETRNPFAEPVVVVAPQCPPDSWWTLELDALEALLDHALATEAIDPDRVYLTGLSMGGHGSWHLAQKCPERFAALVPICGGGHTPLAPRLARLPIWAFHGAHDEVVPLSESQTMVDAVNRAGGKARLTVYDDLGHNAWSRAYDTPALYSWLLEQRRVC